MCEIPVQVPIVAGYRDVHVHISAHARTHVHARTKTIRISFALNGAARGRRIDDVADDVCCGLSSLNATHARVMCVCVL